MDVTDTTDRTDSQTGRDSGDFGDSRDLKHATLRGVRWVAIGQVVSQGALLLSSVALARLLTPIQFGEAALAVILLPLSVLLSFGGFGAALVQRPTIDAELIRAAATMSLLFGMALTAVVFLLAPLIAAPIFGDETSGLIQLISPVFFLGGLAVVPRALMQRDLRFQRLAVIDMAGGVGGVLVSVVAALEGAGASALVLGALATSAISRLMMVSSTPWSGFGWSNRRNLEIVRFGVPASVTSLAFWARQNADYAIVGATLGSYATGLYWRAFQWGVGYQSQVSNIMSNVAFPVLARSSGTSGRESMLALRGRMTRVTNVTLFPMQGLIVATAPLLIPWMFGERWVGAVAPTQLLAVAGMASCATTNHIQVMLAAGHPRPVMTFQVAMLVALVVVCLAAVPLGIVGVCVAVAVLFVAMVLAVYRFLLHDVLGLPMSALGHDLLPAAAPTAALLCVACAVVRLSEGQVATIGVLAAAGLLGSVVYLVVLVRFFPAAAADARLLLAGVLPSLRRKVGRRSAVYAV